MISNQPPRLSSGLTTSLILGGLFAYAAAAPAVVVTEGISRRSLTIC